MELIACKAWPSNLKLSNITQCIKKSWPGKRCPMRPGKRCQMHNWSDAHFLAVLFSKHRYSDILCWICYVFSFHAVVFGTFAKYLNIVAVQKTLHTISNGKSCMTSWRAWPFIWQMLYVYDRFYQWFIAIFIPHFLLFCLRRSWVELCWYQAALMLFCIQ